MADTTATPRRRARIWWLPAILAGLIIGVLLAGAALSVTGHIHQDRYGWRWPAGIGAGALLAAILLVLSATLHEPRRGRPAGTAARPESQPGQGIPGTAGPGAGAGDAAAEGGTGDSAADGARPDGAAGDGAAGDDAAGGTFRRLAAVDPAEVDASWLLGGSATADPGTGGSGDGAFFGGTVPAGAVPAGDDAADADPTRRLPAAGAVPDTGGDASNGGAADRDRADASGTAVRADRATAGGAAGTAMRVPDAADPNAPSPNTPSPSGTSASAMSTSATSADATSASATGTNATGAGATTSASAAGPDATGAGATGASAAGTGATGTGGVSGSAPSKHDSVAEPGGRGADRYGTPLAASGAALGGARERRDAVPGPRGAQPRPAAPVPVPAWAAADSAHDEPPADRPPTGRGASRADGSSGTDEATVPGLLPDEAARIAAVREKLADVLPAGAAGWQVPLRPAGSAADRAAHSDLPGLGDRPNHGDRPDHSDRTGLGDRAGLGGRPGLGDRPGHSDLDRALTRAGAPPAGDRGAADERPPTDDDWPERDGSVLRLTDVRQAPGEWDPHLDIDPERTTDLRRGAGTPVRGYVRAGAAPVPQAAVTVIDLAGRQADKDVSGSDGWYQLAVPRSGTYTLIARARGHQPLASVVAVDGAPVQLDLTLVGSAAIAGTVHLSGTDAAVPGAIVSLMDASGAVLGAVTAGADGTFRFAELIGGGYTLVGNAPGYRPVAVSVTVPSTGTASVEVALAGDADLAGVARGGRDHLPLADAQVTLLDANGAVAGRCVTGPDGGYRFTGLPPGEYTVVASGYPTVSDALHLSAGARHDHDIMLRHPADRSSTA